MIIKSVGLYIYFHTPIQVLLLRIPTYIGIGILEFYIVYLMQKNKAFSAQLAVVYLLALRFSKAVGLLSEEREKELRPYDKLWETIHKGFYPELYNVEREWQEYYSSYVSTYLERDINELISADSITFTKFLTAVAARTGEMLNYANIAGEVGVSELTIKNWISILERTGIVYLLQPYSASALNRAIKTPKIYFRDTGLACYLTRWLTAEALKCSAVAGNMFETFVVSEILKSYTNEGKDYRFHIFYYRGKDKTASAENEIDLIVEEDGVLYPVEIKMSGNPKANMGATNPVLDKIKEKTRGMGVILCLIDKKTYLREKLVALPIEYI